MTKVYYGGMSLAVDMIIEMKDVRTPSLLHKMNVALDIHNDICKLVQSGNYPPSRQATSLENIRQIISKASNDAATHSLHNNHEEAIRIYRELGLCCVKCRHLPMLGVVLSHIAKCAVLAKDFRTAVLFAARSISVQRKCCEFGLCKGLVLKSGSIILMHAIVADCLIADTPFQCFTSALYLYGGVLNMYDSFARDSSVLPPFFQSVSWMVENYEAEETLPVIMKKLGTFLNLHKEISVFQNARDFCIEQVVLGGYNYSQFGPMNLMPEETNVHIDVDDEWKWCIMYNIGFVQVQQKKFDEAKVNLTSAHAGLVAVGCENKALKVLIQIAEINFRSNDCESALRILKDINRTGEECPVFFTCAKMGLCLVQLGRHEDALVQFLKFFPVAAASGVSWVKEEEGFAITLKTALCYMELCKYSKACKYIDACKLYLARQEEHNKISPQKLDETPRWGGHGILALYFIVKAWYSYLHSDDMNSAMKLLDEACTFTMDEWTRSKWKDIEKRVLWKKKELEAIVDNFAAMFLKEIEEEELEKQKTNEKKKKCRRKKLKKIGVVGEREAGIGEREAGIGEREAGIGEREAGIGEREAGIGEREAGIGEREAGIKGREAGIKGREAGMLLIRQRLGLEQAASGKTGEENVLPLSSQNDTDECCVCLSNRKSWIFIPCGHMCVCHDCADDIRQSNSECPLCRQKAAGIFQVFL